MRKALLFIAITFLGSGVAHAECDIAYKNGSFERIASRIPFQIAREACVKAYVRHYKQKRGKGDSSLYLTCSSRAKIAFVRRGKLFIRNDIEVSGC
ncbi:MAG: hypothetical protein AAF732_14650 [Pseudomonadota bacterium]